MLDRTEHKPPASPWQRWQEPALLTGLALLVALLAAACDGGDDPPAATATPAATMAPATATATPTSPTPAAAFPLTIEDSAGTAVTLEAAPTRIISYSPGATEILFAIGAGERVVATDEFSDFPAETEALPKLAYSSPEPESALVLEPDLLLMATQQREQVEQFRSLGMTVLFLDSAQDLDGVFWMIALLGEVTGNHQQAADLTASMLERIGAVTVALDECRGGAARLLRADGGPLHRRRRHVRRRAAGAREGAQHRRRGRLLVPAADRRGNHRRRAGRGAARRRRVGRELRDGLRTPRLGRDPGLRSAGASTRWTATSPAGPGPRIVDGLEQIARLLYPDRFE